MMVYLRILSNIFLQALIVVLTLSMVGLACFGVYRIKMDYKSVQYVDATSYQAKYYKIIQDLFPKYQYGKLTTIEVTLGSSPTQVFPRVFSSELY